MEEVLPIYHGLPWSPYFTFIRGYEQSDTDLLAEIKCEEYREVTNLKELRHLCIARENDWTHIADNYRYSHWHSRQIDEAVLRLAQHHEIFSFSIGDIDYSYEFQYFKNGRLQRKVVWEDPKIDGGFLKEEYGDRLKFEDITPNDKSESYVRELWRLVASFGIETDYSSLSFRAYGLPQKPLGFSQRLRRLFS